MMTDQLLRATLVAGWLGVALTFARLTEPYRPLSLRLESLAVVGAIAALLVAVAVARSASRQTAALSLAGSVMALVLAAVLVARGSAHETGVTMAAAAALAAAASLFLARRPAPILAHDPRPGDPRA